MEGPQISVIISTYNQPSWLEKVLHGYSCQVFKEFEIIIADDGSKVDTRTIIDNFRRKHQLKTTHLWQEDIGFRKTTILNKAILASQSKYLIFTDGDCIPRKDFLSVHLKYRKLKTALSGGYFKLNEDISNTITLQQISDQSCFEKNWLINKGQSKTFKMNKLTKSIRKARFLNTITPTKATFDGMNVSCWKDDILAVNGFDERMQYGAEDREVGERMMNNGIKFLQIRYSAVCIHLYHERPYKNKKDLVKNKDIWKETKRAKSNYTPFGIVKSKKF